MKTSSKALFAATLLTSTMSLTAAESTALQSIKTSPEQTRRALEPTRSLKFKMSDSFWHNRVLVVDGTGDPDAVRVHLYAQDLGKMYTHKYDRLNHPFTWANPKLIETKFRGFRGNISWLEKYDGARVNIFAKALEKIFFQTKYATGNLPIDVHRKYPIWNLHLKNRADILEFMNDYVAANIEKEYNKALEKGVEQHELVAEDGYITFAKKPLLLFSLEDDPDLETITQEDAELFARYFEVVPYNDIEVTHAINKMKINMDKNALKFDSSKSAYEVKLNWRKKMLTMIEKKFSNFDKKNIGTDLADKIVTSVAKALPSLLLVGIMHKFIKNNDNLAHASKFYNTYNLRLAVFVLYLLGIQQAE